MLNAKKIHHSRKTLSHYLEIEDLNPKFIRLKDFGISIGYLYEKVSFLLLKLNQDMILNMCVKFFFGNINLSLTTKICTHKLLELGKNW